MTTRTVSLNRSSLFLSWWPVGWVIYVSVILALGTLPVLGTYPVLSHTTDEPAHIAAGMELLDRGAFTYEQQHPPLARLAVAVGPYLLGARSHGASYLIDEGLAILYTSGDYQQTLRAAPAASARRGSTPKRAACVQNFYVRRIGQFAVSFSTSAGIADHHHRNMQMAVTGAICRTVIVSSPHICASASRSASAFAALAYRLPLPAAERSAGF
jgi:hypothetical protein